MLKNGPDPQCDPVIIAAIGTSLFNDHCLHRIASKLLQTYFCADMYPSLENDTKTFGCLIALAYSNSGKVFSSHLSLVVTIASAYSRSWSNAEVVPSHTFTAEGVKACLFVINVVQPVWPQTDVSFVSFYCGFSHTLRIEVKWNVSVSVHVSKNHYKKRGFKCATERPYAQNNS